MPGSGVCSGAESVPSAAARLDDELSRIARAEWQIDRELARGLALLWDRELYLPLGFARATDFVREALEIQETRARWLTRLGRHMNAVPELDQALGEGRINASQALELGRVLAPDSSPEERLNWIARAVGLGVRELRRVVQAEKRRRAEEEGAGAEESGAAACETNDPDEPPAGGWMTIPAPARVAVLWHGALELARMAAGRQLSQGQAAELVFAEYLSGVGAEVTGTQAEPGPAVDSERERLVAEVIAALNREADEVGRSGRGGGGGPPGDGVRAPELESVALKPEGPPAGFPDLPGDCRVSESLDAWELAETLKRVIGLKRHLRYELAGLLAAFLQEVHPAQLGFPTLEAYCVERLGFGLRRAERLVRFHSGLAKFPRLAAAYLAGRISYTAALLLLPILHRTTEAAWVEWADGITYRELERVVEHARTYSMPEASPIVLESFARGLEEQGLAHRQSKPGDATAFAAADDDATAFAAADTRTGATAFAADVPAGCALPPEPGGLPKIVGLPDALALAQPSSASRTFVSGSRPTRSRSPIAPSIAVAWRWPILSSAPGSTSSSCSSTSFAPMTRRRREGSSAAIGSSPGTTTGARSLAARRG